MTINPDLEHKVFLSCINFLLILRSERSSLKAHITEKIILIVSDSALYIVSVLSSESREMNPLDPIEISLFTKETKLISNLGS